MHCDKFSASSVILALIHTLENKRKLELEQAEKIELLKEEKLKNQANILVENLLIISEKIIAEEEHEKIKRREAEIAEMSEKLKIQKLQLEKAEEEAKQKRLKVEQEKEEAKLRLLEKQRLVNTNLPNPLNLPNQWKNTLKRNE